jgi:tRNA (mo5U34)-methyltransferase
MTPARYADHPGWPDVERKIRERLSRHGDLARWQAALGDLPALIPERIVLDECVTVTGTAGPSEIDKLTDALRRLHPWRKGPFDLFGVRIDTEWRSDWKWQRIAPAVGSLDGQTVLDVGCGNGYFGWRALGAGAAEVVGIDPSVLFLMQHRAIRRYADLLGDWPHHQLAIPFEDLPPAPFDLALSMGVIYHRKDPDAHAARLYGCTRPGGRVLVESLVVEGPAPLHPARDADGGGRYARMRNVNVLPTVDLLSSWLRAAGFCDVELVDVSPTTVNEQRSTSWMTFESLAEALDSRDPSRTVEGHPAPIRAAVMGRRPGAGRRPA